MHRLEIGRAQTVVRVGDATVVCPDGDVEVASGFVEEQGHPEGHEARCLPGIEIVGVRQINVDGSPRVQLSQPLPCELGRSTEPDVAAAVAIGVLASMLEPRLRHDNRRQRVGHEPRRQCVALADVVVTGPIRDHLPVRDRSHGLRHTIPIVFVHRVPGGRTHENVTMPLEHVVQRLLSHRFRHAVPVGEAHAPPQHEIVADIVRGRTPGDQLVARAERDDDGRRIHEQRGDVDRRDRGQPDVEISLQPEVTDGRGIDEQECGHHGHAP